MKSRLLALLIASVACGLSALGQTATNTAQVPAGSTAAIGQPAASGTPAEGKKMLKDALSPETRRTLQQAMDATPAAK